MRGLVEDTKNLSLKAADGNINNNNNITSAVTVTTITTTAAAPSTITTQTIPLNTLKAVDPKTSFTNKTYKMQQQQQQQQQQMTINKNPTLNNKQGGQIASQAVKLRTKSNQNSPQHNNNGASNGAPTTGKAVLALSKPMQHHGNSTTTTSSSSNDEMAGGIQDTIYLCNFRVSVDGDWLCLKELQDIDTIGGSTNYTITGDGRRNMKKNKRYSAGERSSYGILEDNGIFALHNFIAGRRLFDCEREQSFITNMLTAAPHAREPGFVGVFGGGGGGGSNSSESSHLSRDPAEIERSNLVNICKLVVKELLEQSLHYGRMLDSDHLPLQHFFIVIEHVLGHGLRTKKGLLGPRKELWDLLQCVENYCPEAQDITASVRDLPTVRTHIGRARAWLRIALMQKKLADYLQALIEHRDDSLYDYYEPHALMMSDEIIIIMGVLVGLNVIDCNLCVKEEDLDSQQGVIDFSLYLRSSSHSNDSVDDSNQLLEVNGQGNMIAVLDQKNYIEELNRHLNATVANLQAKVESLTTTNALMKEDLAIARNSLLALQAENQALRQNSIASGGGPPSLSSTHSDNSSVSKENLTSDITVLESFKDELEKEKKRSSELEKELKLQVSLKAESDMAMKLLEKDIHDKQDTIISLRRQLDEIKQINLEMYRKLQECEASLKHKSELLVKLETQKEGMASTIAHLEEKWSNDKVDLGEMLKTTSETLSTKVSVLEERATRAEQRAVQAETATKIEREWRSSLQQKEIKLKDHIATLQNDIQELKAEVRNNDHIKHELDCVNHKWSEAQTTLEELGVQLSESKLKVSEMQEKEKKHQQSLQNATRSTQNDKIGVIPSAAGIWAPDSIATHCTACKKEFNLTRRKHHCRRCGEIFCNPCSDYTLSVLNDSYQMSKPVRVCLSCFAATK